MPTNNEQLSNRQPQSVKEFLATPAYKARFNEILGNRAPQFLASLIQLSNDPGLAKCEPRSVIASALIAAVLDFPIEKSLGFAHIVPYGGVAQFQMAAKGYIQLALRSGQYQRLNAKPVNEEAFKGYDEVGEPIIDWALLDETKPPAGYAVAWRLTNGFTKIAYWPMEKVEDHAARFSQAYKAKKKDSPWFTNFDKMALKTVVMNELRAWGVLSVQMQTALRHDSGVMRDLDADVEYLDNEEPDAPKKNQGVVGARREKEMKNVSPQAGDTPSPTAGAPAETEPPTQEPAKPAETPAKPAQEPAKPTQEPAKPAETAPASTPATTPPAEDLKLEDAPPPKKFRCEIVDVQERNAQKKDGKVGPASVVDLKGEYKGKAYWDGPMSQLPANKAVIDVVLVERGPAKQKVITAFEAVA